MDQAELIEKATLVLAADDRVRGVWLTGSHARGTQDAFSDVDLLVVVDDEALAEFTDAWADTAAQIAPIVYLQRVGDLPVFNHVTATWLRFDIAIGTTDEIAERTTSTTSPLYDPENLSARRAAPAPAQPPDPQRVQGLTREFLRVLGLLPVVVGRAENVVGASGAGLLRTMLIQLMVEDVAIEDRGGALHLSRLLPPQRMGQLEALPAIAATRDAVIEVHLACAAAFLPLARDLHKRCGLDWPVTLADAVGQHLASTLAVEVPDIL